MVEVTHRRFRTAVPCRVAGTNPSTVRSQRQLNGLFPITEAGRRPRFSVVDCCVLRAVVVLTAAGFPAGDTVAWCQKFLPQHFGVIADLRINLGVWSGVTAPMQAGTVAVTLDLDDIVEHVIAGLNLPLQLQTIMPPERQALAILERVQKYLVSACFKRRVAAFVARVRRRQPMTTSWSEISGALGVPLWVLECPVEDEAEEQTRPIAERVRAELPAEVTLQ